MTYERPSYRQPGIATERKKLLFTSLEMDVPKFDTPVTPLENFKLAAARKTPYWMPTSLSDTQLIMTQDLITGDVRGMREILGGKLGCLKHLFRISAGDTQDNIHYEYYRGTQPSIPADHER